MCDLLISEQSMRPRSLDRIRRTRPVLIP